MISVKFFVAGSPAHSADRPNFNGKSKQLGCLAELDGLPAAKNLTDIIKTSLANKPHARLKN